MGEIHTLPGATRLGCGLNPQLGVFGLPHVFPLLQCSRANFCKSTPNLLTFTSCELSRCNSAKIRVESGAGCIWTKTLLPYLLLVRSSKLRLPCSRVIATQFVTPVCCEVQLHKRSEAQGFERESRGVSESASAFFRAHSIPRELTLVLFGDVEQV